MRFQLFHSRLSDLLECAKLISRYLENSGLGPQTVQDISFHFAKRFVAKVPENGVFRNVETFCPEYAMLGLFNCNSNNFSVREDLLKENNDLRVNTWKALSREQRMWKGMKLLKGLWKFRSDFAQALLFLAYFCCDRPGTACIVQVLKDFDYIAHHSISCSGFVRLGKNLFSGN